MQITASKKQTWIILAATSLLCMAAWIKFSYPQLAFVDFSIGRKEALSIAKQHLTAQGVDTSSYKTAVIFSRDSASDRYLQKTIGFEKFKEFIKEHDFDLFYWKIRFFREGDKEEYRLTISSSSGEVIDYKHTIPETEKRNFITEDEAKSKIKNFLTTTFGFKENLYSLKKSSSRALDNRTNYSVSWQKDTVKIPWSDEENSGKGKLSVGATISGDEILSFSKNTFKVPDDFNRYMSKKRVIGQNLTTIVRIFHMLLLVASVYYLVTRKNHLAMHTTKKFYIRVVFIAFVLTIFSSLNYLQSILFGYYTTSPLNSYLWRYGINSILSIFFGIIAILMPSLSGELLHHESFRKHPQGSFLHYIHSTFLSRKVASSILMGYIFWTIMLGIQSILFEIGQRYLGVWIEYNWVGKLSTAYLPFLAAFTGGYMASFSEEMMYRVFAISWGKKLFKNTFIAVLVASLIWGFSHSNYPVFPMWFRGLEVTCLGLFLAFVYLRHGLITVLITHYLFDVFWGVAAYLLGKSSTFDFSTSIFVMVLPLIFALIAYIVNKPDNESKIKWKLNKHQLFNLNILKEYLQSNNHLLTEKSYDSLREEIVKHGWDLAVVEVALDGLFDNSE